MICQLVSQFLNKVGEIQNIVRMNNRPLADSISSVAASNNVILINYTLTMCEEVASLKIHLESTDFLLIQ